jgi:hypothetical protein
MTLLVDGNFGEDLIEEKEKVSGVDAAPPLLFPHLCRRPHWAAIRRPRKLATLYLDGRLVGRGEEGTARVLLSHDSFRDQILASISSGDQQAPEPLRIL